MLRTTSVRHDDPRPPAARPRRLFDWKAILGIVIGGGLLYYTFHDADFGAIASAIRQADPVYFILSAAAATGVMWFRAWRWKPLLQPIAPGTSFQSRLGAVMIGFMSNNLLPARLGEFVRAYALSRLEPVPVVGSFASLVLERAFDGLTIVALLFLAVAMPGFPDVQPGSIDYLGAARFVGLVAAFAFLLLVLLVLWPGRVVAAAETLADRFLPAAVRRPMVDGLEAFLRGISSVRSPALLARIALWSVAVWLFNSLGFYLGFKAFHLDLGFTAAVFLNSVIGLVVAIPSLPGFFGLFEAAAKLVLLMWGRDPSQALAFAAGFHIAGFVPVTAIGLYYARRLGITLRDVETSEEVVEAEVERSTGRDHPR